MSEGIQPEVVLNEFGELSRKSRRELIAFGVDPDTAVIEHIRTQSIPVVAHLEPTPAADVSVFSPSLSRRDMRNLRERSEATSEIPFISDRTDDETHDSMPQTPVVAEQSEPPAPLPAPLPAAPAAPAAPEAPTTPTAISDAIASRRRSGNRSGGEIDRSEDSSEIEGSYEAFSISTMSTQSTGVIPTTGSALILPTLPEHSPGAMASFSHTGEIYLTGSIVLPSSMGHYGADFLSLDTSEIDVIAGDDDIASSQDLAPIRASSAVSAYSTSNTVVTVPSKFKDRLPLVLAITAAGLAVGVVALFVSGYVLGVF